jgi:hypothetical protein
MSPNSSSATGSKRLPLRVSTLSSSFNPAFRAVKASARSLTSVATAASAWAAASRAWTPLPVPTSSERRTRGRGVSMSQSLAAGVYVAT